MNSRSEEHMLWAHKHWALTTTGVIYIVGSNTHGTGGGEYMREQCQGPWCCMWLCNACMVERQVVWYGHKTWCYAFHNLLSQDCSYQSWSRNWSGVHVHTIVQGIWVEGEACHYGGACFHTFILPAPTPQCLNKVQEVCILFSDLIPQYASGRTKVQKVQLYGA